jgi:hypothetical protein
MTERNLPRPAGDVVEDGVPATEEVPDELLRTGDTGGVGDMPMPDRPWAADDWGTTAWEEDTGEPLDVRLRRERPESREIDLDAGRVFEPGTVITDDEADLVAEHDPDRYDTQTAEEAAITIREDERGLGLTYDDSPDYLE